MTESDWNFRHADSALSIAASRVAWDEKAFGMPVARIHELQIADPDNSQHGFEQFEDWRRDRNIAIVSCRLRHDKLRESLLLERNGFRFIEMILVPALDSISSRRRIAFEPLKIEIEQALDSDISELREVARTAFKYERYHIDPRIEPSQANERYANWVEHVLGHPTQRLLKATCKQDIVALFIVESCKDQSVYWHLTAIASRWQGKGLGRQVWHSMLNYHESSGVRAVSTRISARNSPVLNLYTSLDFRFRAPEMTFHWVHDDP